MKIGLVVPGGVDRGGTHRVIPHLLERMEGLSARGHDVHVFAIRQEPTPGRWTMFGTTVHNVGRRPRRLRTVRAIAAEHRKAPFDVVHALFVVPQGVVAGVAGRLLGVPVVLEEPGGGFVSMPEIGFGGLHRWQGRAWVRLACALSSRIVVPCPWAVTVAGAAGVDAALVPWGADPAAWPSLAPRPRDPLAPLRIVWVGSVNAVKDPRTMLAVAAALRGRIDFTLDVVGEDTTGGSIAAQARQEGLDDVVRFHGFVTQDALRPLLAGADLMLATSRFEGASRVVVEAASSGVPTVGTAVGYLADWAPEAARTSPPGEVAGLAAHILELGADDDLRCGIARAAQLRAEEVRMGVTVERLEEIYDLLASRKSSSFVAGAV